MPQQIVATLREQAVTVLPCVPPLWLQLLGTSTFRNTPISSLRAMTNTGGRIPTDGVRQLRAAQPQAELFLMYGLTEAFRATFLPPELVDAHPDSIGRAIPGTEIFVLRDDLDSVCARRGRPSSRSPSLATLAIGLIVWLPATFAGMAIMGLALASSDTLFDTLIQRNVPRELLGRVTSVNFFVGSLFVPLSPLLAAALVDLSGPAVTFVIAGLWAAGIAVLLLFISPVRALR